MSNKLDLKDIITSYTFYTRIGDKEKFFCKCGKHFDVDAPNDDNVIEDGLEGDIDLIEAINSAKLSMRNDIRCKHCNTNYKLPENQKRLRKIGAVFLNGYDIGDNEQKLTLNNIKVNSVLKKGKLSFEESFRYISYEKQTNKLFFKDYDSQVEEFDLDTVIKVVNSFFDLDTGITINILKLHEFVIELSKYVSDSDSFNIIKGLLDKTKGSSTTETNKAFTQVITILFSIIKYPNLSTIAMTKSPHFLFEMIKECKPPKAVVLEEANITSPINIFNFLAQNYVNAVNTDVYEEKSNSKEFTISSDLILNEIEDEENSLMTATKGERREKVINIKNINDDYQTKVKKTSQGSYEVFNLDSDGKISKFIYKKLKNFHDYKQLIKYMKHFEYQQLVELMTKYDYDLLVQMIDVIYYRADVDMEEVKRLIPLFIDFCEVQTKNIKIKTNTFKKDEPLEVDYKYVNEFNFEFYDDCKMMLKTLEFDPRKDFYKIKTNDVLRDFHDKVVKYYGAIKLEEEGGYKGYFNKFKFLESREDYNGPLRFEIIDTPKSVVSEGREMHHSVGSYSVRLLDGDYILLRVFDTTEDLPAEELVRFTLGLHFKNHNGLEFDQLKSYGNKLGSNRLKQLVLDWLIIKEVNVNERKPDIRIR